MSPCEFSPVQNSHDMADLALAAPSFSFASVSRRYFLLPCPMLGDSSQAKRFFASRIRSQTRLLLVNSFSPHDSTSSSSSETVAPESYHMTELPDGSIVFSFGHARETERNLEGEEMSERDGTEKVKPTTVVAGRGVETGEAAFHALPSESYVEADGRIDMSSGSEESTESDQENVAQNPAENVSSSLSRMVKTKVVATKKSRTSKKTKKPRKAMEEDMPSMESKDVAQREVLRTEQSPNVAGSSEPSDVMKINGKSNVIDSNECISSDENTSPPVGASQKNSHVEEQQIGASGMNPECLSNNGIHLSTSAQNSDDFSYKKNPPAVEKPRKTVESDIAPGSQSSERYSGIVIPEAQESQRAPTKEETGVLLDKNKLDTEPSLRADASKDNEAGAVAICSDSKVEQVFNEESTDKASGEAADTPGAKGTAEASMPPTTETTKDADSDVSEIPSVSIDDTMDLLSVGKHLKSDEISSDYLLDIGVALLQHPSEELAGREDAYFVASQSWVGIADGVHQWSLEGVSRGWYAQELLGNCQKVIADSKSVPITDPVEVLCRSSACTQSPGSSTVLIAQFKNDALHVGNIGDSGFKVVRNGRLVSKSSPMVHDISFPVQLSHGEDPSQLAQVYSVELDESDLIIMATDGLFDNLYEKEIISIVSSSLQLGLKPQEIAESLAGRAQEVGRSAQARTPFADAAKAAGYVGYQGGKLDAVTVILCIVRKRS